VVQVPGLPDVTVSVSVSVTVVGGAFTVVVWFATVLFVIVWVVPLSVLRPTATPPSNPRTRQRTAALTKSAILPDDHPDACGWP
jgi:hypothetical protein